MLISGPLNNVNLQPRGSKVAEVEPIGISGGSWQHRVTCGHQQKVDRGKIVCKAEIERERDLPLLFLPFLPPHAMYRSALGACKMTKASQNTCKMALCSASELLLHKIKITLGAKQAGTSHYTNLAICYLQVSAVPSSWNNQEDQQDQKSFCLEGKTQLIKSSGCGLREGGARARFSNSSADRHVRNVSAAS